MVTRGFHLSNVKILSEIKAIPNYTTSKHFYPTASPSKICLIVNALTLVIKSNTFGHHRTAENPPEIRF